jgi:hypothetical protein
MAKGLAMMALALVIASRTELALAQAAWDQFFDDVLARLKHPNPSHCHDVALDRTIRALGRRPRAPMTPQERSDLLLRTEVESLLTGESARADHSDYFSVNITHDFDSEQFESLCDNALNGCEVHS